MYLHTSAQLLHMVTALLVLLSLGARLQAQATTQLLPCGSQHYWVVTSQKNLIALKLTGTVEKVGHERLVVHDGHLLQVLATAAHTSADKASPGNTAAIEAHIEAETKVQARMMKQDTLNVQRQSILLKNGHTAIQWWYAMPDGYSADIQKQVFLSLQVGHTLVSLSTVVLYGEHLQDAHTRLLQTMETLEQLKNLNQIRKRCKA